VTNESVSTERVSTATGRGTTLAVAVVLAAMAVNYMDRAIMAVLLEPIGSDLGLPDSALGLLAGLPFALFYALVGVPFARVADVWDRRKLIAFAVAAWSLATVACGLATGLFSLFVMRMLVGIGEGAGTPALHSCLVDLISPAYRPMAAGLFVLVGIIGGLLGFASGGILNDLFGWRMAFVMVGLPGVLVALLVWWLVPEHRAAPRWPSRSEVLGQEAREVFLRLWALRSFRFLVVGFTLAYAAQNGIGQWAVVFVSREHGRSVSEVGPIIGVVVLVPAAVASIVGGALGMQLSRRFGIGWLLGLPALACVLSLPGYLLFVYAAEWATAIVALIWASLAGSTMMAPIFAAIYAIARSSNRATVVALVAIFTNIFGLGAGPLIVGVASDGLAAAGIENSLAHAMALSALLTVPGVVCLALGARDLGRDVSGE
jgi:predicted MFS family arabinose efflux permease